MSGGKGGGSTNVSNSPWGPLQPYITGTTGPGGERARTGLMPEAERLYKNGPGFFTPFDPLQQKGQESALNYANNFGDMYAPFANAGKFALNAPDLSNNPYLEPYMQAATRPLEQQLNLGTMPGIRSQFVGTQGGGTSTRQGVAEGVAQGLTNQAIGDTRAKIAADAYGKGLDQQARAMALYPEILKAGMVPADIERGIGAERREAAFNEQVDPYEKLRAYAGMINPLFGSGYGYGKAPRQGGGSLLGDLGSLLTGGAALWSVLGGAGAGGAASGAATLGMFSDPKLKKEKEKIGRVGDMNLYKWEWNKKASNLGLEGSSIGVMADEVSRKHPEALGPSVGGYKTVNYTKLLGGLCV